MDNFYLIYGIDKSLVQREREKILKKLNIDDIVIYDVNNNSLLDIVEDASTMGLFSSKKVIVLDDCYFLGANKSIDNIEVLEDYIEKYNSNNYCILTSYTEKIDTRKKIFKLLNKHKVIELKKIDSNYLTNYVEEILKSNNCKMENIDYFLKRVGNNLDNIKNELDKLMIYKIDNNFINNNDVDKICEKILEEEIFVLTDAIIYKDIKKSLTYLEDFLNQGYDEMQIIMLLASQFRFMFQVKRLLNKNKSESEIAKILEVNPYRVKFTIKKLYSYSEDMLIDYIKKIAKMDHDIKLGIMDKRIALELFVIQNK